MSTDAHSNKNLVFYKFKRLIISGRFWLICFTALLVFADSHLSTLFGAETIDPLSSIFSLSPSDIYRSFGLTLVTYPLFHTGWNHWVGSALLWFLLAPRIKAKLQLRNLDHGVITAAFYLLVSIVIALSFKIPFAPFAETSDRILGLSALIHFQIGFLILQNPSLYIWILSMTVILFSFGAGGSPLSTWGHGVGLTLGLLTGLAWRF